MLSTEPREIAVSSNTEAVEATETTLQLLMNAAKNACLQKKSLHHSISANIRLKSENVLESSNDMLMILNLTNADPSNTGVAEVTETTSLLSLSVDLLVSA